jgi:NhaP-type Na+/H+ or K+/H+ antiporter
MLSIGIMFIFVAAIAFLGFLINALFYKFKITDVMPLMIIGLLVGPIFELVNTGPQSIIVQLTPYFTAVAIAFVLFEIGMNIKFDDLRKIILKATVFTFAVQIIIAIVFAVITIFILHWSIFEAFIFGFAVSGPSTIIVPTLARMTKVPNRLKVSLIYESVLTDIGELIIPIILIGFIASSSLLTVSYVSSFIFTMIFGSILLGIISAFFWLYILNKFKDYSKGYSWILTITMIIATYGIAQQIGLNGAITSFVFGLLFYNIGHHRLDKNKGNSNLITKYFSIGDDVEHTKSYQHEIVFFVSAFFFVYIGLLFSIQQANYFIIILTIMMSLLIIPLRYIFVPLLRKFMSKKSEYFKIERSLVTFDIARGLSPAIIAILIVSYGINIPYFIDMIFLIILFTNIESSIGIFATYKPTIKNKKLKY